jgi:hypothetical protein
MNRQGSTYRVYFAAIKAGMSVSAIAAKLGTTEGDVAAELDT